MGFNLYDLQRKVEFQDLLTEQERAYVETHAQSPVLVEAIDANIILAISGAPGERQIALGRLEALCTEQLFSDSKASFKVMHGLMYVPDPLPSTGRLREFVFRMSKEGATGCRGNGVLVLERLAFAGDSAARALIEERAKDSDEHVRHNAVSALRHLDAR